MSLQLENIQEKTRRQRLVEIKPSKKVVVARPGSRAGIALHVEARRGLHVRLEVEGLEPGIASYHIIPQQARTPFTLWLELHVSPSAVGVYPFKLTALSPMESIYSIVNLVLIILPRELPMEILGHLQTILAHYRMYGIQYVIWYLLKHLFNNKGMSFTKIKALYELLKRKRLSNGTVGDPLERMERKA